MIVPGINFGIEKGEGKLMKVEGTNGHKMPLKFDLNFLSFGYIPCHIDLWE